jgi:hypothetical protein
LPAKCQSDTNKAGSEAFDFRARYSSDFLGLVHPTARPGAGRFGFFFLDLAHDRVGRQQEAGDAGGVLKGGAFDLGIEPNEHLSLRSRHLRVRHHRTLCIPAGQDVAKQLHVFSGLPASEVAKHFVNGVAGFAGTIEAEKEAQRCFFRSW